VTKEGLVNFKGCKNLTHLEMIGVTVTDEGLANFKDCKSLTYLALNNTKVTEAGLANFAKCKDLTVINLSNTTVSNAGLAHFDGCGQLIGLDLGSSQVTDGGLAPFKDCKQLGILSLYNTPITDKGLAHFMGCRNLSLVNVAKSQVTPGMIAEFAKVMPQCKIVHDGGVLEPAAVTDPDRRAADLALFIGGIVKVNGGEKPISTATDLPKDRFALTRVDVAHTVFTNDETLAFFKSCKKLTELNVQKTQVTATGVAEFAKALPQCKIVWDGGTIEPKK
jgi:hypothetical protein